MVAKRILLLSSLALLGIQCGVPFVEDDAIPAEIAGDRTLIIRVSGAGCNTSPEVGYAFCRKAEGRIDEVDQVYFYAPQTNCDRDSCGLVEIFSPEGTLMFSRRFPKEGGIASVAWSDFLQTPFFRRADNGTWPVLMRLYWKDSDGNNRVTGMRGEIRLIVYTALDRQVSGQTPSRSYQPLHNSRDADVWAFESVHGAHVMKWSTAGRAYVGSHR